MNDPDLDRFTSRRSTVHAPRGVVATSQPLAAAAGHEVLRDGGNAFDAAVATAAALNVVEPTKTGLGGDVFALYRTADGNVGGLRSCGGAPADMTIEATRERLHGADSDPELPFRGALTVTVPGTARGWELTVSEFGRLSLGEVLDPAIEYATGGFPVSEVIAQGWKEAETLFTDQHAREAYLVDGERAPRVGERTRLRQLGRSLRTIAEQGADVVYEGDIAEAIAAEVQAKGGFLTVEDLASFEPELVDPVTTTYCGAEVYELPPNNQGLVALEALNIAEELDAGAHPPGSPARVHRLVEAVKLAFHDGHQYITDPEYEEVPALADKEYAAERAAEVGETAASSIEVGVPGAEESDTVLLCVADDAGNVVSYINSRFKGWGSGLVAGETGIALQNRGAAFSLDPDDPNRLEPGKRPFHTLIPGIVNFGDRAGDGDGDWAAFGVMGGYMQPQGHVQVLSALVDDDATLQEALDRPRWRYLANGQLAVEARVSDALVSKLVRRGHDVTVRTPDAFGGGQLARVSGDVRSAASDPRKDGTAIGY
jgi:gamma-glutamyltranspeptidase/glutathione hydrolase